VTRNGRTYLSILFKISFVSMADFLLSGKPSYG
jgi:hypothetical protein